CRRCFESARILLRLETLETDAIRPIHSVPTGTKHTTRLSLTSCLSPSFFKALLSMTVEIVLLSYLYALFGSCLWRRILTRLHGFEGLVDHALPFCRPTLI